MKRQTTFIFVRHGETDYNKLRRAMGSGIDAPLNNEGREQARRLASELQNDFELIVSSPLKRALESAQIVARVTGKPLQVSDLLKERDYGSLAGKNWQEIGAETEGRITKKHDTAQQYDYSPYGGESREDVQHRLEKFLEETSQNFFGKKILVMTHGGIIRLMHYLHSGEEKPTIPNSSTHIFEL